MSCSISKEIFNNHNNNAVSVSEYDNNLNDNAWVVVESDKEKNSCYIKVNGRYYKPDIVISGQMRSPKKNNLTHNNLV